MFCEWCGKQNEDGSRFCIACGKPVTMAGSAPAAAPVQAQQPIQQNVAAQQQQPVVAAKSAEDSFVTREIDFYPEEEAAEEAVEPAPAIDPEVLDSVVAELGNISRAQSDFDSALAENAEAVAGVSAKIDSTDEKFAELGAKFADLGTKFADLGTKIEATDAKFKEFDVKLDSLEQLATRLSTQFDEKIAKNEHEATVLKQVSAEVQDYRDGLYEKLTLPLIKDVIKVREDMKRAAALEGGVDSATMTVFSDMLADSLSKYSVEVETSKPGDDLVSYKHKVIGSVVTDNQALHGKIAEVEGDGYRIGEQYIAPAMVRVYSYAAASADQGVALS